MFNYYTCIIIIACVSTIILSMLVWDNNRYTKAKKISFIHVYMIVFVAALSEWCSLYLNGADMSTVFIHKIVKALDYCFTPMIAYFLAKQFDESKPANDLLFNIQIINCLFQLISIFTGWTFYIDETNTYQHGVLYIFYVIIYMLNFAVCIFQIIKYASHFRRRNLLSLIMIFLLMFASMVLHEILPPDYRITYLGLAIGLALLYIHYSEFYLQKSDDIISYQDNIIRTDSMTKLLNRYSYGECLDSYEGRLPENNLVVFSIDINGLKKINDVYGHEAGDEIILGAANSIKTVLSEYGKCFRTGGDEFVCVLNMKPDEISAATNKLSQITAQWKGKCQDHLFLAVGYALAAQNKDVPLSELIKLSDEKMYKDKEEFYEKNPEYRRA